MDTKALRQKVLDLAIRGKLVPQDPNDEPASVLLEHIRQQKQQMVKEGKLKAKDIKNDTVIFVGEDNLHYEKFADGSVKCIEDEIPFDLPDGWAWCRLLPLTTKIGAGSTPTGGAAVYSDSGVKFIRSQNVYDDGLVLDDVAYISENINQKKAGSVVKAKDILLNITGGSIGRCALVPDDFDMANVNQHVIIIRLVDAGLRHFLHSVIISPYIQEQIFTRQVGSGRGGLSAETLSTFLIPVPPIQEQSFIQEKLNQCVLNIATIVAEKNNITSLADAAKAKILDLAIRGQLIPQNPDDEPASVLLERIKAEKEELIRRGKIKRDKKESVIFRGEDNSYYEKIGTEVRCIDSELPFELPDSWIFVRLKNVGEIVGGGTPKTNISEYWDGNIPWLTPADFSGYEEMYVASGARTITEIGLKSSSAQMLPANSVLYSSRAPIGYIAIAANHVSTNQGFKSVVPYDYTMSPYLYYCLKARTDDIIQRATGTTFKEISGSEMAETIIPLPPITEQKRIVDRATQMLNVITTIEKSLS